MPTYVYKFVDTGETIEIQQSFSDATLTEAVHPATGQAMAVKKVFQPVGVTFKGDGFYKTDSRSSKGSKSSGESGNGSTKDAGAKTDTASSTTSTASSASSSSTTSSGSSSTSGSTAAS